MILKEWNFRNSLNNKKKLNPVTFLSKKNKLNLKNKIKIVIRQDLSPTYHKNGACYAIDSSFLLNSNKEATPIGENSSYIITEDMISIDEINDFKIIEEKIKQTHLDINEYIKD